MDHYFYIYNCCSSWCLCGNLSSRVRKENFLNTILEINISNLAGVPSIIYGLLGLEIFVRISKMGSSVLAGSFTLALLILPIIIVATREALKQFPHQLELLHMV